MGKINVKTKEKRFPIAPHLYGLFFEDINRSADGGLYPELIRNRSFEDSIVPDGCKYSEDKKVFTSPTGWVCEIYGGEGKQQWIDDAGLAPTDIPAWYAEGAEMTLNYSDTLNIKRRAALDVTFNEGGRIYNVGFVGVSVEAGKGYDFYMFAKGVGGKADVTVSVESRDGAVYFSKDFTIADSGYAKYNAGFVSSGTDHNAIFVIRAKKACAVRFGFTSLMPADTYNGHGMRTDLMKLLRDMKPKFLRFPGGCIVEGFTTESMMRFSKTVGPVWERPTHWNLWNYRTTNGLGFHEYLQICEDLDLEPMYVFNCGMTCQARCPSFLSDDYIRELLEEAKNAIEYATGSVSTKWGSLRAAMGHPAPFKLTYVEIGNENWGPEYNERYEKFYRELKALYPHLKFISNTHTERDGLPTEIVDEHFYNTPEFFAENMDRYDSYPRSGPEIFVGEFAVTSGGYNARLRAAVAEAMFMVGLEKNQDIVKLASYAPLFENVHYKSWDPNLLVFNNHQSYGIPSYYVWKLFANHRGTDVLTTEYEGERIYRPYCGAPSIIGRPGVKYRNARYNGKPIEFADSIIGGVNVNGDEFETTKATEDQLPPGLADNPRRAEEFYSNCFITIKGDGTENYTYEVEAFAEEGKPLYFGIHTSKRPESEIRDDMPAFMQYKGISWIIEDGKSYVKDEHMRWGQRFTAPVPVSLKYGEYNTFKCEVTPIGGKLYINGELVGEYTVASYTTVSAVALDDAENDTIIIKAVNFSDKPDDITITLDCPVESKYKIHRISGSADDKNSFDSPTNISDVELEADGASQCFVYSAPSYSVSVLILKKA